MTTIGEWTIRVRTQSENGNPATGQNIEVMKLVQAIAWNLPVKHDYQILGTNEDGSYEVEQEEPVRK